MLGNGAIVPNQKQNADPFACGIFGSFEDKRLPRRYADLEMLQQWLQHSHVFAQTGFRIAIPT